MLLLFSWTVKEAHGATNFKTWKTSPTAYEVNLGMVGHILFIYCVMHVDHITLPPTSPTEGNCKVMASIISLTTFSMKRVGTF